MARRNPGEGSLSWNDSRQRWVARVTVGYGTDGKRQVRSLSARTKTEAKDKLQRLLRQVHDGTLVPDRSVTVAEVVEDWLRSGLPGRAPTTVENRRYLAETHILPALGRRRLADLRTVHVEQWLAEKSESLSTATLTRLLSILRQVIRRAQSHELVGRNVAALCEVPVGRPGRPSASLTFDQARAILAASKEHPDMHAYVVLSLLTGARTEELRALHWEDIDLDGAPNGSPPRPPAVFLIRSVRHGGDTKTRESRRALELPKAALDAVRAHHDRQGTPATGLVFRTGNNTPLDAANVRRAFRKIVGDAGLDPTSWTPRELRHSFVSLLSNAGLPIEEISRLVGHATTRTTERIYRKELRPVLRQGTPAMDRLFDV